MSLFRSKRPHADVERRLGYRFGDSELLATALTHRSYANEQGLVAHYERLEFLGDAVLDLVSADWLFRRYPEATEGELSRIKSFLVSEPVLADLGCELGLGAAIRLGVGEERSGGREKPSLLADAVESVIGAVYLDGGPAQTTEVVQTLLRKAYRGHERWESSDPKSALQELLQAQGRPLPRYFLIASEGPDHEKLFTVAVRVGDDELGQGSGRSKKIAEQEAAQAALQRLRDGDP